MDIISDHLIIESQTHNIRLVEEYIESICIQYGLDEMTLGNILICVTEAVNNAIIHGNKAIKTKKVTLSHSLSIEKPIFLSIKVEDEGTGFNYFNLPDPTAPENLEMVGGRGIFIINQLADSVIFSDSGNAIEMQFRI